MRLRPRWLVVLVGVAAGLLARDVPLWLAMEVVANRSTAPADCGDRTILECAVDNIDDLVGALVRVFVALLLICAVNAVVGVTLVVVGALRRWPWAVALGAAFLVPVAWQAGSFTWHLLT